MNAIWLCDYIAETKFWPRSYFCDLSVKYLLPTRGGSYLGQASTRTKVHPPWSSGAPPGLGTSGCVVTKCIVTPWPGTRSCGPRYIFLHLFVPPPVYQVHPRDQVSASVHAGIPPPGAGTPPRDQVQTPGTRYTPQDQVHPPRSRYTPWSRYTPPPPPGSRLRHTVNERPVRILLECILVTKYIVIEIKSKRKIVFNSLCCLKKYLYQ